VSIQLIQILVVNIKHSNNHIWLGKKTQPTGDIRNVFIQLLSYLSHSRESVDSYMLILNNQQLNAQYLYHNGLNMLTLMS